MRLCKELRIHEVKATESSNAPFEIVLWDNFLQRHESTLVLDADACAQYGIPMSLDIVGLSLACSFESREVPLVGEKGMERLDMASVASNTLMLSALKQSETATVVFYTVPPSKIEEVTRTLELSSFGGGDGIHFHVMPCPFYQFIFELTQEEYETCKAFSPLVVFKVDFRLMGTV